MSLSYGPLFSYLRHYNPNLLLYNLYLKVGPIMPGYRLPSHFEHNIHFVNSENDELGGAWQTGSLTWAEMSQRMDIVFELPTRDFTPLPCLEDGNPKDPIGHHGPPINIQEPNNDIINPGFYVLPSPDGEPVTIPVNQEMPLPRALSRSLSRSDSPLVSFTFSQMRGDL